MILVTNFPILHGMLLSRFRMWCCDLTSQGWFDFVILIFIACNCITLAMERPNIPPWSFERDILNTANHVFTVVFGIEMYLKVMMMDSIK
jgi:voltage-dependent calcium channel T type alpha-1G